VVCAALAEDDRREGIVTIDGEPCTNRDFENTLIGEPCPQCGHMNIVHGHRGNPAVAACLLCVLEAKIRTMGDAS
jgi:hypothetical protein